MPKETCPEKVWEFGKNTCKITCGKILSKRGRGDGHTLGAGSYNEREGEKGV